MGLVVSPLIWFAPAADATGVAVCAISGTINFSPASLASTEGAWRIEPAVITCQGVFKGRERIIGPGSFTGSGSYSALPGGSGTCMRHVGTGTVDYTIQTTSNDVHINEQHDFVMAGAGAFTTPSLRGSFQVTPPYKGDCVTKPVTSATFVAQAVMVRTTGFTPL
jgi:hypothetical protein